MPHSAGELNRRLMAAFGIECTKDVRRVTLDLRPGQVPSLVVTRIVFVDGGVIERLEALELQAAILGGMAEVSVQATPVSSSTSSGI